jgi:ribonuclease HII
MEKPKIYRRKEIRTMRKNSFERIYWQENKVVCGIDEAGRGPLAGPVVAAAVMTEAERERSYRWILKNCYYGIGIVDHTTIDKYNIYQSTLLAMRRAVTQLVSITHSPLTAILVDAMPLQLENYTHAISVHAFIEGERLSISVAAASIVAKVTRDRLMTHINSILPGYGFAQHKGYGTPEHHSIILAKGTTLIHRKTFVNTVYKKENSDVNNQQLLW